MRWAITILMFLAIEIYAYQALKTVFKFNWISKVYVLINFCAYLLLSYRIFYIEVNKLNYSDKYRLGTAHTEPNYNVILIKKDSIIVHTEDFLKLEVEWFETTQEGWPEDK